MVEEERKERERWRREDKKEFLERLESYSSNETNMFKTDIDMLCVNIDVKLEMDYQKFSGHIFLRKETQEKIEVVNRKFNSLSSGVFESLELRMSETKQSHTEMSKKFHG
jgi:hypothetical protein